MIETDNSPYAYHLYQVLENTISDWNSRLSFRAHLLMRIREHYKWLKHDNGFVVFVGVFRIREHYKWLKHVNNGTIDATGGY